MSNLPVNPMAKPKYAIGSYVWKINQVNGIPSQYIVLENVTKTTVKIYPYKGSPAKFSIVKTHGLYKSLQNAFISQLNKQKWKILYLENKVDFYKNQADVANRDYMFLKGTLYNERRYKHGELSGSHTFIKPESQ